MEHEELVGRAKISLSEVIKDATKDYLEGTRDGCVRTITTSKDYFGIETEYIFVAFHPSYVELCWRSSGSGNLGNRMATFYTDEDIMDVITECSAVLIERHHKYR